MPDINSGLKCKFDLIFAKVFSANKTTKASVDSTVTYQLYGDCDNTVFVNLDPHFKLKALDR